ncbi:hypothetical protein GCM10023152_35330 [Agromyces bauzanensis]|uniref:Uncharacterized protein n=1 Tax=Agromyces bauzanensis TaxID=1308924 RepID=A0A917PW68_9MICO|nr:hypothetical protein GCM10011372_36320 [Agromyces bauzanensis]
MVRQQLTDSQGETHGFAEYKSRIRRTELADSQSQLTDSAWLIGGFIVMLTQAEGAESGSG